MGSKFEIYLCGEKRKKYLGEESGRKGRFTIRTRRKTLPKMRNLKKFFSCNGYFENWFD